MTQCLGVDEYLSDALELLLDEGLLKSEDGEDLEFDQYHDLSVKADALVLQLKDDPILLAPGASFEWLEGFRARRVTE